MYKFHIEDMVCKDKNAFLFCDKKFVVLLVLLVDSSSYLVQGRQLRISLIITAALLFQRFFIMSCNMDLLGHEDYFLSDSNIFVSTHNQEKLIRVCKISISLNISLG